MTMQGREAATRSIELMEELLLDRPELSSDSAVSDLRQRLRSAQRQSVLFLLLIVETNVIQQLVPELFIALLRQRDTELVRQILARLPRAQLQITLGTQILSSLATADDEIYRRVAELLYHLGLGEELRSLVESALKSGDPAIREVGEDFSDRA